MRCTVEGCTAGVPGVTRGGYPWMPNLCLYHQLNDGAPVVFVAPDGYRPGESVLDFMARRLAEKQAAK